MTAFSPGFSRVTALLGLEGNSWATLALPARLRSPAGNRTPLPSKRRSARRKHPYSGLREVPRANARRRPSESNHIMINTKTNNQLAAVGPRAAAGLASKTEGRPCSRHQTAAGGRPDSVLAAERGCKELAPVSSSWPPPAARPSCRRAAGCWRPRSPW